MKPSFALNLSHDGLSLLHRAKGGWRVVDEVALDDPDLSDKLRYLHKTAAGLAGGQLVAKLVIPNSQILYKTVDIPTDAGDQRETLIRKALEGATPYDLDDLVFDWVDGDQDTVHVAAVARKTLAEAETFAADHRFNPVSFVAIPEDNEFPGEPFFGETEIAQTILGDGETIERDDVAIAVVGHIEPTNAPQKATDIQPPEPEPDPEPADVSDDEGVVDIPDTDEAPPPSTPDEPEPTQAAAGMFATRRVETDHPAPGSKLGKIEARFVLYGDKLNPEENKPQEEIDPESPPAPKLGSALKIPEITPMPVTAPSIAGGKKEKPFKIPKAPGAKFSEAMQKLDTRKAPDFTRGTPPKPLNREAEAEALTVFGARRHKDIGGKPKYLGLFLTLALVAVLVLVALISSVFVNQPVEISRLLGRSAAPVGPAELVGVEASPDITTLPLPEIDATDFSNPDASTLLPAPELEQASLTAPDQAVQDLYQPTESELAETDEPQLSTQEIFSSTGIWSRAPTPPIDLDADRIRDLYVASIDRQVISHDAVALPGTGLGTGDHPPGRYLPPLPEGTVFDLDARGFVRATADGTLTPRGIFVFLGKPAVVPNIRPREAEVVSDAPATQNLNTTRPIARPENLIQQNERAQLGGKTRSELGAIRPVLRPSSPQDNDTAEDFTPTDLAVLSSRSPVIRPANFATVVEKSRAAAAKEAALSGAVSTVSAGAVAPATPSIPTSASVARQATVENAINLSKVNLIGIYGSSSDRRALVRLKNGRYLKVKVGDRLDGGKVAAIGTAKLQYIKRKRTITLELPKG